MEDAVGSQEHQKQDANPQQPLGGRAKRAFDVALATAMLILAAPIMLTVTALVRTVIGGSAVVARQRVGFNGEIFACYKFRTVAVNAGEVPKPQLAENPDGPRGWQRTRTLLDDRRVEYIGCMLRRSGLDELPQLLNVLRGDMSFVGPRPIAPDQLDRYRHHARTYFRARPGLTGFWRTGGRTNCSARIACDRYYVNHWSLWLDLVLLVRMLGAKEGTPSPPGRCEARKRRQRSGDTVPTIGDDDARRWRLMALEALVFAHHMTDPECSATMLRIAAGYDHLAELAERNAREPNDPTEPSSSTKH